MVLAGLSQRLNSFEQTQKSISFLELKPRKEYIDELEEQNQQTKEGLKGPTSPKKQSVENFNPYLKRSLNSNTYQAKVVDERQRLAAIPNQKVTTSNIHPHGEMVWSEHNQDKAYFTPTQVAKPEKV